MAGHDETRWSDVERHERTVVGQRRREPLDAETPRVGLAISGGGIRSATFGLGVLESLKQLDFLSKVDYLSTVSGGGYIGAWLTAGCKRSAGWMSPSADWLPAIAHLRRYSNYLSPAVGLLSADTWSMATIWLRNTLLIQTTVILGIACALLVPRPLFELFQHWPYVGDARWASIILFVLGIVGVAANQMRLTSEPRVVNTQTEPRTLLQAKSWPLGAAFSAALIAVAWIYARWMAFHPFQTGEVSYRAALPVAALIVLAGFALLPVAVQVVGLLWRGDDRPTQINYTQNWVQLVVVIPLMMAACLVAGVLWGEAIGVPEGGTLHLLNSYGELVTTAWRYWPFPLSVVFVSFWLLSFLGIRDRRSVRAVLTAFWAPAVAVGALHGLLCVVMLLLRGWAGEASSNTVKAFVWAPPLVALAFTLSVVVLIGMLGRQSTDDVREWWSRLGAWLGIYATAWMVVAVSAVYGPVVVAWVLKGTFWKPLVASGGWVATVVGGLLAGNSASTVGTPSKSTSVQAKEVLAAVAPFVFIGGLLLGVGWALDQVIWLNATQTWQTAGSGAHTGHSSFLNVSLLVLAACAGALLLMASRVDINQFSLNSFYRNRLVRCYLGATRIRNPQNFTGFDGQDDLSLADLSGTADQPFDGPLHIVNCALNLGGSSDLALHTRHSAAFTLSPLYCGSAYKSRDQAGKPEEIGFLPTRAYGSPHELPTLGQAISVSGAAASPNMGYHTSPVTAFLLTLFNVRLGWWYPHPTKARAGSAAPALSLGYLLAELFGGANDTSGFLMISDGGHFENLAAYELIRRRCGLIVISDAECDPQLAFEGLGTLIRMCEVDFGVGISIDVKDIRTGATGGWSEKRYAVGTIDYGPDREPGTLVYLKASMTGSEDTPVLQYKASHPAFPHESTGDQFYREDQFESYRRLGREVALSAFNSLDAQLE